MSAHFGKDFWVVSSPTTDIRDVENTLIDMYKNGKPLGVLRTITENGISLESTTGTNYVGSEFLQTFRDITALIDEFDGLQNGGVGNNNKGERNITNEFNGVEEKADIFARIRKELAFQCVWQAQNILGWTDFNIFFNNECVKPN